MQEAQAKMTNELHVEAVPNQRTSLVLIVAVATLDIARGVTYTCMKKAISMQQFSFRCLQQPPAPGTPQDIGFFVLVGRIPEIVTPPSLTGIFWCTCQPRRPGGRSYAFNCFHAGRENRSTVTAGPHTVFSDPLLYQGILTLSHDFKVVTLV